MRRVAWSEDALAEFEDIVAYIAGDNPAAAIEVADRIERAVETLALMPTGRWGRVAGTYEKLASGLPYIIVYALGTMPDGAERSPSSGSSTAPATGRKRGGRRDDLAGPLGFDRSLGRCRSPREVDLSAYGA